MKTHFQIKRCYIFMSAILFIMIFPLKTMALDVETHRAINEKIVDKSSIFDNFSLQQYLINQLGFKDGVDTLINNKRIVKYIGDGGEYEDNFLRYVNHFHNPITNQGLIGFGVSASTWAILPVGSQKPESYSWNDVRSYYYTALTSKDKAIRDDYFAMTFRGVGQVMHAVEDMSVPAHTRNDPHGLGDGYETWAIRINDAATASAYTPYSAYNPYNSSFLIPQLFDTDQYDGTNSGITLSNSIGLAEYTNANFFIQQKLTSYLEV